MLKRPDRPPPPERSFWELLPRRNFRRAVFLVIVFLAVLALRKTGGGAFRGLFDAVSPAAPAAAPAAPASGAGSDGHAAFQHLRVAPATPQPTGGSARP
jgi:hypothetical protein